MRDVNRVLIPLASLTILVILIGIISQNIFAARLFSKVTGVSLVPDKPYVIINEKEIFVDIADNPTEWQLGLSGRKSLSANEGMLFIFDPPNARPSFWMEGMYLPLDIIWINDGVIVQMDLNIPPPEPDTPSSELPLFVPLVSVDHVLEVNAGFVKEHGIAVGDIVDLSNLQTE